MRTAAQLKDWNFLGWIFCAAILLIAVNHSIQQPQSVDFTYFYSVGKILNHYEPVRLYDADLQHRTFNETWPVKDEIYGPSPYPPFVAILFRPFALLSFRAAFLLWAALTLILYLGSILLLASRYYSGDKLRQSLFCCIGLLYWPFVVRTLLNGQLSAIGLTAICCAVWLEEKGYEYGSGAALTVCIYKPTLLILIVPMLIMSRRWKTLVSLSAGAILLICAVTLSLGPAIWPAYFRMAFDFAHAQAFGQWDYVDLVAFSRGISGGQQGIARVLIACALIPAAILARIWFSADRTTRLIPSRLLWGITITWMLILNLYSPLYDTILIVPAIVLTGSELRKSYPRASLFLFAAILISSYFTRELSKLTGVQILDLFLIGVGILQARICFGRLTSKAAFRSLQNREPHATAA